MIYEQLDYRNVLREKYLEKAKKNSRYSLRSFAMHLGLSSGGLTLILKGTKKLSLDRGLEIADKLGLDQKEKDYFCLLIQREQAKNVELKEMLQKRINLYRGDKQYYDLSVDYFKFISDWYHLAIFELIDVQGFDFSVQNISAFLGLNMQEAELAVERLKRLELIEWEVGKKPAKLNDRVIAESTVPNEALRKYYKQIMLKAMDSIEQQTPQEKVIGTEVFAFDDKDLKTAQEITYAYLDQMLELGKKGKNKKQLYQLAVQFFRLNKQI